MFSKVLFTIAKRDKAIQVFNNRGRTSKLLYVHLIEMLCGHLNDGYGQHVRARRKCFQQNVK